MIRVLFRARDNGQEFPVYFTTRDEIAEAAATLQADVVSEAPATQSQLELEQLLTLLKVKP